jgi:spermidine synthase
MSQNSPQQRATPGSTWIVLLFALTTLQSAYLIFLVQPMVGKHILPWFGGAPAVWTLCLAFYQTTLFLGYAYAHLLERWVRPALQPLVHACVLLAAFQALPVLPDATWKPAGADSPSWSILAMLSVHVAPPFLFLASQGPLLQAWFGRAGQGRSPYPLYAVSNLGSLLALVSFPIIAEPTWPLSALSRFWSFAFVLGGALSLGCVWLARRPAGPVHPGELDPLESTLPSRPGPAHFALWIALPACAVMLLMGVTNELCMNVASVPFLWVVPLCVYLLTFIISFGAEWLYDRGLHLFLLALAIGVQLLVAGSELGPESWVTSASSIQGQAVLFSLGLFAACMLLHGELHRLRPAREKLTAFYLCISGGGALGGLFVGLVAPQLFDDYLELSFGALAALVAFYAARRLDPKGWLHARDLRVVWVGAAGLLAAGAAGLAVTRADVPGVLHQERSFFGVLRVIDVAPEDPRRHRTTLRSGTTIHGAQLRHPKARRLPSTYYGELTGIGMLLRQLPEDRPARVGTIGLGIGTVASYGRPGDRYRFYEIDPQVITLANDEKYFSYLADSPAEIEIVTGDARLSLESEMESDPDARFDVLIVDAFSSDAIPVHLLTLEAFRLYRAHLGESGVLALHLSNLYLDLPPVALRLCAETGLHALEVRNVLMPRQISLASRWIVASPDEARLEALAAHIAAERERRALPTRSIATLVPDLESVRAAPLWTDDYSDLYGVLQRPGEQRRAPSEEE